MSGPFPELVESGSCQGSLQIGLAIHQFHQPRFVFGEGFGGLYLGLEFPQDESRAPPEENLRHRHVGEEVVAHVQDLVAVDAEMILQVGSTSANENSAWLERARLGAEEPTVLIDDSVEGPAGGEERRLVGRDDHRLEQIAPAHAGGQVGVECVLHDPAGVIPV